MFFNLFVVPLAHFAFGFSVMYAFVFSVSTIFFDTDKINFSGLPDNNQHQTTQNVVKVAIILPPPTPIILADEAGDGMPMDDYERR